jgi:hypothetical protein
MAPNTAKNVATETIAAWSIIIWMDMDDHFSGFGGKIAD